MRSTRLRLAGALTAATLLGFCLPLIDSPLAFAGPSDSGPAPKKAADSPVVVELFTSQGCHSCPPADDVLREIGAREDVIALAFHVDYWNRLGWQDPFSKAEWSDRQRRYAVALRSDTVYTPQLVVQGEAHVVGSNRRDVERALKAAPAASVPLDLRVATTEPGSVTVEASSTLSASELDEADLDLVVALYQRGLRTAIPRGENGGKTLRYDYVVRSLERPDRSAVTASSGDGFSVTTELRRDPAWELDDLGVVALLQKNQPGDRRVVGSARAVLSSGPSRP